LRAASESKLGLGGRDTLDQPQHSRDDGIADVFEGGGEGESDPTATTGTKVFDGPECSNCGSNLSEYGDVDFCPDCGSET